MKTNLVYQHFKKENSPSLLFCLFVFVCFLLFLGTSSEEGVGICFSICENLLKKKVSLELAENVIEYSGECGNHVIYKK